MSATSPMATAITHLTRHKWWLGVVLLGILPGLLGLTDFLLSDDWHHIWIATHRTQPLWAYFFSNYEGTAMGGSYRPLVSVFWAVVAGAGGMNVAGRVVAHVVPLLAHLITVLLVGRLAWQVSGKTRWVGLVAASWFALLPNHAEAVLWPAAMSDPVATALFLGALLLWMEGYERTGRQAAWRMVASSAFFLCALLAKESVAVLSAVALAWALVVTPWRRWVPAMLSTLPLWFVAAAFVVVRYLSIHVLWGYYGSDLAVDPMVALRSVLAYAVSSLLSGQARIAVTDVLYAFFDRRRDFLFLTGAVVAAGAAVRIPKRGWWLVVSFLLCVLPVMRFGINHLPGLVNDEGERYAYLPSVFVAIILGWLTIFLITRLRGLPRLAVGLTAGALMLFCVFQLGTKVLLWHEAAQQAAHIAERTRTVVDRYPGTLLIAFGLSDNLKGVPLWRNGLSQMLEMYGLNPNLSVSALRSMVEPDVHLSAVRTDRDHLAYHARPLTSVLVGPSEFSEPWVTGKLGARDFFLYAISYRDFSAAAEITLRPVLREYAALHPVVLLFWNGSEWQEVALTDAVDAVVVSPQ